MIARHCIIRARRAPPRSWRLGDLAAEFLKVMPVEYRRALAKWKRKPTLSRRSQTGREPANTFTITASG